MSNTETNNNMEDNSESLPQVLDIAVPNIKTLKGLKPWQRRELLAVYQWIHQNDPSFQDPMELTRRQCRPKLICKSSHRKKSPRSHHRQHY